MTPTKPYQKKQDDVSVETPGTCYVSGKPHGRHFLSFLEETVALVMEAALSKHVPWHLMTEKAPCAVSSHFLPLLCGLPTLPSVGHAEK